MGESLLFPSLVNRVHPLMPSSHGPLPGIQSPPNLDDVTTIFVVGFPDDMQEREFQNMFTFSPGFEAASLKWHCKDDGDDNATTAAGAKKQMIGFARFRTRVEAIKAAEALTGKKVDAEKGTVLKAEMAKKNLHIKRGSLVPPVVSTGAAPVNILPSSSKYETFPPFSPLPSDLFSSKDYPASYSTFFSDDPFDTRSPSFDMTSLASHHPHALPPTPITATEPRSFHHLSLSPPDGASAYLSKSTPAAYNPLPGLDILANMEQLSLSNSSGMRNINPADQNPPCNTLYVGNLPPDTSEDELRQLFHERLGYKRMCFRNKAQGPMCFVEFDGIDKAGQAMAELQGCELSNSVKGGIRLSYSKNPLFIKPTSNLPAHPRRESSFDPQL